MELIQLLHQTLTEPATVARFRVAPTDWTRQRRLSFRLVVLLILQGHKQALQTTLNKCFRALGAVRQVPTASALCQARHKLQSELFLHLNHLVTAHFYQQPTSDCAQSGTPGRLSAPDTLWHWRGQRLLGVDGTRWNLPDTLAHRAHFGSAKNQHDPIGCAQAQGSVL